MDPVKFNVGQHSPPTYEERLTKCWAQPRDSVDAGTAAVGVPVGYKNKIQLLAGEWLH